MFLISLPESQKYIHEVSWRKHQFFTWQVYPCVFLRCRMRFQQSYSYFVVSSFHSTDFSSRFVYSFTRLENSCRNDWHECQCNEGQRELHAEASSLVLFSGPSMLIPLPGTTPPSALDKYAVFKGITSDKPSESPASLGGKRQLWKEFLVLLYPTLFSLDYLSIHVLRAQFFLPPFPVSDSHHLLEKLLFWYYSVQKYQPSHPDSVQLFYCALPNNSAKRHISAPENLV